MIYAGLFSFHDVSKQGQSVIGDFCCLVEADSVDDIFPKFQRMISKYQQKNILFQFESVNIHLETIIEIKKIPKSGALLSSLTLLDADKIGIIHGYVPANEKGLQCFKTDYSTDSENPLPFMTFRSPEPRCHNDIIFICQRCAAENVVSGSTLTFLLMEAHKKGVDDEILLKAISTGECGNCKEKIGFEVMVWECPLGTLDRVDVTPRQCTIKVGPEIIFQIPD